MLELARASYHRLVAELQVLLSLPANLPSGYHRDLQLTKEAAMRSALLADDLLTAMQHLLPGVRFAEDRMAAASDRRSDNDPGRRMMPARADRN